MRFLVNLISTGFGSGYAPIAPGTAGTLLAALIYFVIAPLSLPSHAMLIAVTLVIGTLCATITERQYGKDSGKIVVDEMAGYWISVFMLPVTTPNLIAAFVFFRVFDILKPYPANVSERWKGGWGVMADDLFAGVYANILMHAGLWLKDLILTT